LSPNQVVIFPLPSKLSEMLCACEETKNEENKIKEKINLLIAKIVIKTDG
jgi:hypothetical protein